MTTQEAFAAGHLRLVLPSAFDSLERVLKETEPFVEAHIEDQELAYRIVLLTTEAVTNAIEHGNALDPAKQVVVVLEARPDCFEVAVEDEGGGFNPASVEDPLAEENLMREGGRGIYLIESMADEVHYERDGRCMRIVFHR